MSETADPVAFLAFEHGKKTERKKQRARLVKSERQAWEAGAMAMREAAMLYAERLGASATTTLIGDMEIPPFHKKVKYTSGAFVIVRPVKK